MPVLLDSLEGDGRRPWDDGEFTGPADIASADRPDPGRVLETLWARNIPTLRYGETERPDDIRKRAPFTREFPGLA